MGRRGEWGGLCFIAEKVLPMFLVLFRTSCSFWLGVSFSGRRRWFTEGKYLVISIGKGGKG